MLISKLIKKTKLPKDTIRYYERIGLTEKPKRLANGYRDYHQDMVNQLKFIKMAQAVGFTLKQIKPALPYVSNPKPNCPFLQQALNNQLTIIDDKIESLEIAKSKLIDWREKNRTLVLMP